MVYLNWFNILMRVAHFKLTSGILNVEPIAMGSIAATVNAGLEGFVKAASLEYSKFRINVVSPTVIEEALDKDAPFFTGFKAVKAGRSSKYLP